jgi:glycosyltransferase involved in cell wall biosynthesis
MKVCFISEAKSTHTQRWACGLAQAGCEIHLISSSEIDIPGIEMHPMLIYSANPIQQLFNNMRIKHLIGKLDPEVIHLFGLFSVSSLGAMTLIGNMKNLVISVWGSDVKPGGNLETFKERAIKKYLLNRGDCLVAVSEYLAHEVQRYLNQPRDIEILPWGVDLDMFRPVDRKGNFKVVRVGFAKKLYQLSGPDILLKALQYARDKCKKKLLLKIAGDGPMEAQLKQEAIQMGLADSIEWLGWLGTVEALRGFYHSIDLFVMPSRRESFGVSAVEASATGLPVIASRFGGIPEIVIHGETGLLVDPEDVVGFGEAISLLAGNSDLRLEMGLRGRERVKEKFDWRDSVESMVKIYNKVRHKGFSGVP